MTIRARTAKFLLLPDKPASPTMTPRPRTEPKEAPVSAPVTTTIKVPNSAPVRVSAQPVAAPAANRSNNPFVRSTTLVRLHETRTTYSYYAAAEGTGSALWHVRSNGGLITSYPTSAEAETAHDAVVAFLVLDGFIVQ